jgi:hypothetical protein
MRPAGAKELILLVHAAPPKCYSVSVLVLCLHVIKPSCPVQHVCSETELCYPGLLAQKTMKNQSNQETTDQIINTQVDVCLLKDERASQTSVLVP